MNNADTLWALRIIHWPVKGDRVVECKGCETPWPCPSAHLLFDDAEQIMARHQAAIDSALPAAPRPSPMHVPRKKTS